MRQLDRLRGLLAASFHICCLLTAVATAQDQPLQLGTPIERQLSGGEAHTFTVTLEENTLIQLVVEQHGIDVVVRVSSPAGKNLGDYDSPNGTEGPENVSFVAISPGAYRITVTPLTPGDVTPGKYQIKILELRQATEQEIHDSKNVEVVKAKGVALLAEVEGLIGEIRSSQTRIRAQFQAAQLLWDVDEKRATKYITDAMSGLKQFLATAEPGTQEYARDYQTMAQLRHEMVHLLAQHDPEAALNFLQSTKLPAEPYGNRREQAINESGLELMVANEILARDPKRALQIARQNLKTGYSMSLANTLSTLRQKNPEFATDLASEIATKLLGEKLLKRNDAANLSVHLIQACHRPLRRVQRPGLVVAAEPILPAETCSDLFQKALKEALSYTPPRANIYSPERDAAWNILSGLQSFGPELDSIMAGSLAAVEKKLAEMNGPQDPYQATVQQLMSKDANAPADTAIEAIQKAPEEVREQLYMQLANMTAANGEIARAKQIINDHIANPYQRRQALANLEQQEMYRAMSQGKVEEALKTVSTLPTPRERANLLVQIARQIGPGQKRAAALTLLEQARSMLAPAVQAQDGEQMNALLELARAFSRYDSKRAFEIVDPLVEQLNDLCAAARTLEGFGAEYYEDDELNLQNGSSVAQIATQLTNALGTLATTNFERAKLTSDRLRLPEVRLRAYLDIARQTILGANR